MNFGLFSTTDLDVIPKRNYKDIKLKLNKKSFEKWQEWMRTIKADLVKVILYQDIFEKINNIVIKNTDHINKHNGYLFFNFIKSCYFAYAAMGIRRQMKDDDKSFSLIKILRQIKICSKQFTYDFYLSIFPIEENENKEFDWQELTFTGFTNGGCCISEDQIENDILSLKKIGEKINRISDRYLAHLDKRIIGKDETLSYQEISSTIKTYERITCKYIALLLSEGYSDLHQTIMYDWQSIFNVPINLKMNKV